MNDRNRAAVAERARAELDDTRWDAVRTPAARRLLVLAFAASLAVVATTFLAAGSWGLVALAPAAGVVYLLRRAVRTVADLPDEHLDERLLAMRDRTYVHAYRILSGVVVVTLVVLSIAVDRTTITYHDVSALFWPVCLGAIGLPSAVLAWTSQD